MFPLSSGGSSHTLALESEQATMRLVAEIAAALKPGDLITLSGDLGAGKTTFARALIRHLANDPAIAVPSPSFTLMQTYDLNGVAVVHADLYRLDGPGELSELGFDDMPKDALVLLEWPDRAAGFLPEARLDIAFTLVPQRGAEYRNVRITGYGSFGPRAERIAAVRTFLEANGFAGATRRRIQGDASTRSYERLTLGDRHVILMNAPRQPDGPPIRDGKPYSAIAHLAEDVKPFVAMAEGLSQRGLSAPQVIASDLTRGLLILEDLGDDKVVAGEPPAPVEERYAAAVDCLVHLHGQQLPDTLPVSAHLSHTLPHYDMDALMIEVELLLDWYLPHQGVPVSAATADAYRALWREALHGVIDKDNTWVLRDYHSPNLMWLAEREGVGRVGLLDFQDAVMGPAAYDLASLLHDARVDVPEAMEVSLLGRYVRARRADDPRFDPAPFIRAYSTLAAQRASKILGIFARLDRRDGKPQYLRHMPRVWNYLQRALAHPSLSPLAAWMRTNVPEPTTRP